MKWALLGSSDETLRIAEQIRERGDSLIVGYEIEVHAEKLVQLDPHLRLIGETPDESSWEDLLHHSQVEAVLVASQPTAQALHDRRHDQLRKLCQAGVNMLMVHPACDSIVGFELDMIRRDTGSALVPWTPGLNHPLLTQAARLLSDPHPDVGSIDQVVFERTLPTRNEVTVYGQLSRDILLLLQVVGEIRQVNAMGTLNNLSVQMGRRDDLLIRWNLSPGDGPAEARLTLIGSQGRAELRLDADGRWEGALPKQPETGVQPGDSPPVEASSQRGIEAALDELESIQDAQGQERSSGQPEPPDTRPRETDGQWFNACRSQEITEVVPRCLSRGRTIELYYDDAPTEEATFKGMMAAGGCGILLLVLFALVAFSVVEGIRLPGRRSQYQRDRVQKSENIAQTIPPDNNPALPEQNPGWPLWLRLWPVYPLAIFLGLQLLKLVFQAKRPKPEA